MRRAVHGRPSRRSLRALVLSAFLSTGALGAQATRPYDLLLVGGEVVDGTGAPRRRADVGVRGDRIVRIAPALPRDSAVHVLDARGLVVAPGFIDLHAHAGLAIADHPLAENFLRQGITTTVAALHSQDQPWPLAGYAEALRTGPNVAFFAGHTWIRKRVLGLADRAPSEAELAHMVALVDSSMRQGAFGLATGLEYVPATYAATDELVALARAAARQGGLYVTHLRDEGPRVGAAVREALRVGREGGLPVHLNHLKLAGAAQFGGSGALLALLDSARQRGDDVTYDVYPYTAFATYSDLLFPAYALAGGTDSLRARLADRAWRARLEREMIALFPMMAGRGLASVQFSSVPSRPSLAGRTLRDLVRARGRSPTVAEGVRAVIELQRAGGFLAIFHSMDEGDVERLLRHDGAMVESDGDVVGFGLGFPHPRSYGAFPRVLARYVRERGVLTLEAAVRRMTALPAARLGLAERGLVREGAIADLVAFDPAGIADRATYLSPHQFAVGVVHLLVNGEPVMERGSLTGARPGRGLRRPPGGRAP